MTPREYFASVQSIIRNASHIIRSQMDFDEISENECYLRGKLTLIGGYELYLAEYIITEPDINRLKYRYHVLTSEGRLIGRWDNAPHHPEIKTHPHHFHSISDEVKDSFPMDISKILWEIIPLIPFE